jgi:hypothetical protein
MGHCVDAAHDLLGDVWVAQVAPNVFGRGVQVVGLFVVCIWMEGVDDSYVVTVFDEAVDDEGADETGAAGDEDGAHDVGATGRRTVKRQPPFSFATVISP